MRRRPAAAAALAALLASTPAVRTEEPQTPRELGLTERASTQLAQIDVTVAGPKNEIEGLTASDFEVRLNDKLVTGVLVDALCGAPSENQAGTGGAAAPQATAAAATSPPASAQAPQKAPISYLFYLDMPHLTQAGRRSSIDAARAMIPPLLAGGNRAMLVSNSKNLRTIVPLTSDVGTLDAALQTMINSNDDFDPYAAEEENRLAEVVGALQNRLDRALLLAREYAREERQRQERDLARLRMVLGRLAELDPPKAAIYFADTMRQNPGEHYLSFFSESVSRPEGKTPSADAQQVLLASSGGVLPLDRVINEADANGIRFYTVEGQGLAGPTTFIQAKGPLSSMSSDSNPGGGNQASPALNGQRNRDAQGTLVSMAAETGGRAFLNGVTPAKMTAQILDDLRCVYLVSFDPKGFPEDQPLDVTVRIDRPHVKVAARGRLVIASESTRMTARVLSAYAAPTAKASEVPVRVGLIPVGYRDGYFHARVQLAIPGSKVPGTTWDLGASLVSTGRVVEEGSGRITLAQSGVPAVWEKDMSFNAGDYQLVAVAHELTTDGLASKEIRGSWPKLETDLVSFGPVAVSQQARGGFLRNGKSYTSGAMLVGEEDALRPDVPTAVVSLVCRAKDEKKTLSVVRTLVGEGETPVGTTTLKYDPDERCAQILDFIPAHDLGPGSYRYVIDVRAGDESIAKTERKLVVPDATPADAPQGAPSEGGS